MEIQETNNDSLFDTTILWKTNNQLLTQNQLKFTASKHSISEFYKGTTILLTGASGFVGKALLEKLIRSCEEIETIFVILRSKKGSKPEDRLKDLFTHSIFDVVREKTPERFHKVKVVEGDVSIPNLGLTETDRHKLTSSVDVVFHSAANVRFNGKLQDTVVTNTLGTKRVLDLACCMSKLKSFVFVSTAYSNADKKDIEEIVYKPPYNPKLIVDCIQGFNSDILEALTQKIIGKHPNTYTFSKAMAEHIVQEYSVVLPVAIVRPSIVTSAWKEPIPGWIDTFFGVTGTMAEITRGSLRSAYGDPKGVMDIIPVDIVVNTLVAAAWHTVAYRSNTLRVYNCTSGTINRIYWKDLGVLTKRYAMQYPTKYLNWYPEFSFHSNHLLHRSYEIFLHRTLAFVSDIILYCIKKKPTMVKLCKAFENLNNYTYHFTFGQWNFHVSTMKELVRAVKAADDGKNFDVDVSPENGLNWDLYFKDYVLGIKKYIIKDKLDGGIKNKLILHGFYWANMALQLFSLFVFIRIITYRSYLSLTLKNKNFFH